MKTQTKRIIGGMVMAVSLAASLVSLAKAINYSDKHSVLNKQYEVKQTELYNLLKNDPDYQLEYKNRLQGLQADFFAGEIGAQQYDNELHELTKTDSLVHEFSQRPEVKQEYSKEVTEMEQLKAQIDKQSMENGIPCMIGLMTGVVGCTAGTAIISSTIDKKEEDKFYL